MVVEEAVTHVAEYFGLELEQVLIQCSYTVYDITRHYILYCVIRLHFGSKVLVARLFIYIYIYI